MKKRVIFFVLLFFLYTFSGRTQNSVIKREVKISYYLNWINRIGSNQLAIWIEDENGNLIKTIYVTKFTAKGGYKKRAQALRTWVKKYNPWNKSEKELDSITAATQKPGVNKVIWDCKDEKGNPVKDGKYYYVIEGNIYFDNMVYAKGEIVIGKNKNSSIPVIRYYPENAYKLGILIEKVEAIFE